MPTIRKLHRFLSRKEVIVFESLLIYFLIRKICLRSKIFHGVCRPAQCVVSSMFEKSAAIFGASLDFALVLMSAFYYHKQPEQCFSCVPRFIRP